MNAMSLMSACTGEFPYQRNAVRLTFSNIQPGGPTPVGSAMLMLLADIGLYTLLFIYLDCVLPVGPGVKLHPLWFLKSCRRGAKRPASNVSAMAKPPATGEAAEVSAERARVLDEQRGGLRALGLSKVYDGAKKPAIVNVQFGVNDGECFGLLGSNGAGAGARWHRRHRPRHPPSAPGWADSS